MKMPKWFPCLAGAALFSALSVSAHPYASGVTNNHGTVQFILNENSSSVAVTFNNGAATNKMGALLKGSNGFSLGSYTNYAITVYNVGSGFAQTSSDTSNSLQFISPRGVGVNINPQRPNFGRIYVGNAWPAGVPGADGTVIASAGNGRLVQKGIYAINQDGSDSFGQGANALLGNIVLGTSFRYSPWRLFVGSDDSVYVGDGAGSYTASLSTASLSYSPPGGGIWMASPDFSSTTNIFDTTQEGTVYGGIMGFYVNGSLAATNLVVTALEWDEIGSTITGDFLTPPAVWQYVYDSATNPVPFAAAPYGLFILGLNINGVLCDLSQHGPTGYIYAIQDRSAAAGDSAGTGEANNNNAELYIYDSTGATNIWESGIGGANIYNATYGMAVSPDGNWLACAEGYGVTVVTHITNGIPDLSTMVTNNEDATLNTSGNLVNQRRSVVWDAADNLITSLAQYNTTTADDDPTPAAPAVVREYSLGYTSIATTSNDATATNGSFHLTLLPPPPKLTGVSAAGANVTLTWTSPIFYDATSSFTVQSASSLNGQFSDVTAAVTQPGGEGTAFTATVAASGPATFYRIHHL
ncbi:MAG TPA: hypothetical protein VGO59_18680 [Verrucomicrobiae bacterium]|jgi:hypothetical protein